MSRPSNPASDWREQIAEIQRRVRGGAGTLSLLKRLRELEQTVESEIERLEDARRRRVVGPRARTRAAVYSVENSPRGLALTERRPGAEARPYKVPLPEYRAVAYAFAASGEPQAFSAVKEAVSRRLGEELPDYAVRVPLRFWAAVGLLGHERARFTRIGSKSEFIRRVRDAWKAASSSPFEVRPD